MSSPDFPTGKRLIDTASIYLLEDAVQAAGGDPEGLWTVPQDWAAYGAQVDPWVDAVGAQLGRAAAAVCAVIDFEAVVIDGDVPTEVRERLCVRARAALREMDLRGLLEPELHRGMVGPDAGVLGAASKPILSQFFLDTAPASTVL
jgi:predicted NBD/HSP70 family sugar kinase